MKLEIKHLAPYLQHQLDCIWQNKSYTLQAVTIADRCKLIDTFDDVVYGTKIEHIKPKLVPLNQLSAYSNGLKHLGYRTDENNILNLMSLISNGTADYKLMQMCFEEYIDVFGLIDKGLAVDINTLSVE